MSRNKAFVFKSSVPDLQKIVMICCIYMISLYLSISYHEGCEVVTSVTSFIDIVHFPDLTA